MLAKGKQIAGEKRLIVAVWLAHEHSEILSNSSELPVVSSCGQQQQVRHPLNWRFFINQSRRVAFEKLFRASS